MNLHLSWDHDSIPLFDIEISEEENNFPKAKIVVDALSPYPKLGTKGMIKTSNEKVLFQGVVEASPNRVNDSLSEIILISRPPDYKVNIQTLLKKNRLHPFWDGLYIPSEKHNDFNERQDIKMTTFACHRLTGEISECDLFQGNQKLHIGGDFFKDSLKITKLKPPLSRCEVKVHVHWIQKEWGMANISSSIRRAFPNSQVSTYSKDALLKNWPERGKYLGRSGIWVLKSGLKARRPTGANYPAYSKAHPLQDEKGKARSYKLRRFWFKPTLWVGWKVKQLRKETLTFTLEQTCMGGSDGIKHLDFTLQNINPEPNAHPWMPETTYTLGDKVTHKNGIYRCLFDHKAGMIFEEQKWHLKRNFKTPLENPARASFFLTDRGYLAAEHAMERARVEMKTSRRNLKIVFETTWEKMMSLVCDTSITLNDPRIPGGEITGKVIAYSFIAKGDTGEKICRVTLLCLEKTEQSKKRMNQPSPEYVTDYLEDGGQVQLNRICETPTGLKYMRYDGSAPPLGHIGPFIRRVDVANSPLEQEADFLTQKSLSALYIKPTSLRVAFKDLRTRDILEHTIPCTVTYGDDE
jgi:hypothetical protein